MTPSASTLLSLLRVALGNGGVPPFPALTAVEWRDLIDLSFDQGVPFMAVDGLNLSLEGGFGPDMAVLDSAELESYKYEWFSGLLRQEDEYGEYLSVVRKLADIYASAGIKVMLLKGYGLSLCWPEPSHRPMGDIDIFLVDEKGGCVWSDGDALVSSKGIKVDSGHHHHTTFGFCGKMVENHFDFVNVYSHRSGRAAERLMKSLAGKPSLFRPSGIDNVYLPPLDFDLLFVMRHLAIHFASENIILRQLLDWALFVRRYSEEVDWRAFWQNCRFLGMESFAVAAAGVCIDKLGFDETLFHIPSALVRDIAVEERVFEDILAAEPDVDAGHGLRYIAHRLGIWWRNRWKHRLVYTDSLFSTFLYQIAGHLMKPGSIVGR